MLFQSSKRKKQKKSNQIYPVFLLHYQYNNIFCLRFFFKRISFSSLIYPSNKAIHHMISDFPTNTVIVCLSDTVFMWLWVHVFMYLCESEFMCLCFMWLWVHVFVWLCNCEFMCLWVHVFISSCVCLFVFIWACKLTEMTFPRADRDLLILAPSFNLSPVAPVLSARSDPGNGFFYLFITLIIIPWNDFNTQEERHNKAKQSYYNQYWNLVCVVNFNNGMDANIKQRVAKKMKNVTEKSMSVSMVTHETSKDTAIKFAGKYQVWLTAEKCF